MTNIPFPHSTGCGCADAPGAAEPEPAWFAAATDKVAQTLDVRPILAKGGEPFAMIMAAAKQVPAGGVLLIEAPFDPAPLKKVLGKQGFESYSRAQASDHWQVYFHRRPGAEAAERPAAGDSAAARTWRDGGSLHIDVRGLPPPQPMLAILGLIDGDTALTELIVHHEREPVFLYPELAERGWTFAPLDGDPGEVRLRLSRLSP